MPIAFRPTFSRLPAGWRWRAVIRLPRRSRVRPAQSSRWRMRAKCRARASARSLTASRCRLGRPSYCGAEHDADALAFADPEASAIAFAHGDQRYVFAVRQRLRADAAGVIARLRQMGLAVEILSGDRAGAVEQIARQLGIENWRAETNPADKIAHIEALKAPGPQGADGGRRPQRRAVACRR